MKPIRTYSVTPALPQKLIRLKEIANNVWWSWDNDALLLFRRLGFDLWESTNHNPIKMLGLISQERLEELTKDEGFMSHFETVCEKYDEYVHSPGWAQKMSKFKPGDRIAYFSAEFGLTESIPIYSGGLGILAGDHLKSASDLGIPLIGVGLLYQEGYFQQYLNSDGWQGELYPKNDFYNMPVELQKKDDGSPVIVSFDFPGRTVYAQIWLARVGRVLLFLLDCNIPLNQEADRNITEQLYGGDSEMRIQQEIVLGVGGVRALKAMGIMPKICHMNEGHSAFLALERIRQFIEDNNVSFQVALEATKAGNVFTTHTPVPAGIDVFSVSLMEKYFSLYCPKLRIGWDEFLDLGREHPGNKAEPFSMAVLALRLAASANGVSKLHGVVSRQMWQGLYPQLPEKEIPITSVTNGIHQRSWVSIDMVGLLDRYLGPRWRTEPSDSEVWENIDRIPDEELWRTHERRRERLVGFGRVRLQNQLRKQGAPNADILQAEVVLKPEILTIGFARRFATYKRADLLLRNKERLAKILNNEDRPVQIIFSGKAHPKDNEGKKLIQELIRVTRTAEFRHRIVFLENYDTVVSRYMVQGVDIWLNTPRRLYEASGTSGMKAAANGVINMSILDGWWDEAYKPEIGWAIDHGEEYKDIQYQYEMESNAIYNILEKEIIPLFYERGSDGLPRKWIRRMKDSMKWICPQFNTNRMVYEYTEKFYVPVLSRSEALAEDGYKKAKNLAEWKKKLREAWPSIRFEKMESSQVNDFKVGNDIELSAQIFLGTIKPDDVSVEAYYGVVSSEGIIQDGHIELLRLKQQINETSYLFEGKILCHTTGLQGYTLRIIPKNELFANPHESGLIYWAS